MKRCYELEAGRLSRKRAQLRSSQVGNRKGKRDHSAPVTPHWKVLQS